MYIPEHSQNPNWAVFSASKLNFTDTTFQPKIVFLHHANRMLGSVRFGCGSSTFQTLWNWGPNCKNWFCQNRKNLFKLLQNCEKNGPQTFWFESITVESCDQCIRALRKKRSPLTLPWLSATNTRSYPSATATVLARLHPMKRKVCTFD